MGRTNAIFGQQLTVSTGALQLNAVQNVAAVRKFSVLSDSTLTKPLYSLSAVKLIKIPETNQSNVLTTQLECVPIRTVTKCSHGKGKRKSMRSVVKRFFRLHWGGWIRTISGRHKKMYMKSKNRKRRIRQHVLVNSTQSLLLDKMVTKFWKRPKHYIDDIYEPYHNRTFYYARWRPMPMPPKPLTKAKSFFELSKQID